MVSLFGIGEKDIVNAARLQILSLIGPGVKQKHTSLKYFSSIEKG